MKEIIAELLKILKDAEDSISWEESVQRYFAELICETLGIAMEWLDDEIAEDWKKDGWRVERRDARTVSPQAHGRGGRARLLPAR